MKRLIALIFLLASNAAFACPDGYQPAGSPTAGNPSGCVPYSSGAAPQSQAPQGRWETRWGAIATDVSTGAVGTVIGMNSKKSAVKAAMARCYLKGSTSCKSILAYYNQCAVIVTGDKQHLAQSAATVEEASEMAIVKCNAVDTNCTIYYSDCSLAAWVQ